MEEKVEEEPCRALSRNVYPMKCKEEEEEEKATYAKNIGECSVIVVSILIDKWIHKLTLEGWVFIANY